MKYVLTEYAEGHTYNRYFETEDAARACLAELEQGTRRSYPIRYRVWRSVRGVDGGTIAVGERPAEEIEA